MQDIAAEIAQWVEQGERLALATVIHARQPSPRPVGACLAVTASGKMAGSVSGGCVEGAVFQEMQEVIKTGTPKTLHFTVVDEEGWEVGLACGGEMTIYAEPWTQLHDRLLQALNQGETVAWVTSLEKPSHLLAWPDGRMEGNAALASALEGAFPGPLAERRSTPQGDCFVQVFAPPPTLNIVGAVHLAQPLVRFAKIVGYRVRVIDPRATFATRDRFPTADELVRAWPQNALTAAYLRPADAVVSLTHDPKFDIPALATALRSPVGYIGLLGSPRTQRKRQEALREQGFDETDFARIHGPVGFKLGNTAEAIALGIMAEIVAVHQGKLKGRERVEG